MSDNITIPRGVLEALVEMADGCGYAVCPYHDSPVDERLVPTRLADLETVAAVRRILAAAEVGCIADLCTNEAQHYVKDFRGETIGLCSHHHAIWQEASHEG